MIRIPENSQNLGANSPIQVVGNQAFLYTL